MRDPKPASPGMLKQALETPILAREILLKLNGKADV